MDREVSVKSMLKEVLKKVQPSEEERMRVYGFVEALTERLNRRLLEAGIEGSAEIHGSVAKDTWLSGDRDLDIFIVLKKTYTRAIFPKILDIVKQLVGTGWVEAYAEHPYIQAEINGFKVDFVPCFEMDVSGKPLSATDRTPLHTIYVKEHLRDDMRKEVLLLKQFMHGIGVYGAEVKAGGFSGYLCELLTIHYSSFLETLKAAGKWKKETILDIANHYKGREEERKKLFREPLVVVDPIDERRNVASPVTETRLRILTAACRAFLKAPRISFFFPSETQAFGEKALKTAMKERGSGLVFLFLMIGEQRVPDVLWGQLYRTEKALRSLLGEHDFKVIRTAVWSEEKVSHILIFEVESSELPKTKLHRGPPVEMEEMSERFLRKHSESRSTIAGPWIENNRWWVEALRDHTDAKKLLEEKLQEKGGISVGVPRSLVENLAGFSARVGEEVIDLYKGFPNFRVFLTDFLIGRPKWLS